MILSTHLSTISNALAVQFAATISQTHCRLPLFITQFPLRGLLASKMYETAKGIIYNLISLIEEYGHVLNGARSYYTNMSQPPLLSSMVIDTYNQTSDKNLIVKALHALLKEHDFWTSGVHMVVIEDAKGSK